MTDVAAALVAKIELLHSAECEPEVGDDGEKEFDGADLGDCVGSVVSEAVIGQAEECSGVQPRGQSEPQRGRAALLDLGDHAKTGGKQVDCTGMRPTSENVGEERGNRMSGLHSITYYVYIVWFFFVLRNILLVFYLFQQNNVPR